MQRQWCDRARFITRLCRVTGGRLTGRDISMARGSGVERARNGHLTRLKGGRRGVCRSLSRVNKICAVSIQAKMVTYAYGAGVARYHRAYLRGTITSCLSNALFAPRRARSARTACAYSRLPPSHTSAHIYTASAAARDYGTNCLYAAAAARCLPYPSLRPSAAQHRLPPPPPLCRCLSSSSPRSHAPRTLLSRAARARCARAFYLCTVQTNNVGMVTIRNAELGWWDDERER